MIGFETSLGTIEISQEYFANLISHPVALAGGVADGRGSCKERQKYCV